ncbi:MAG: T9SS type A sorting domain-containing protein [Flavobacteriaceae bacterium]
MKHLYTFFTLLTFSYGYSQVYVSVDENASWAGYMNVFDNSSGSQGGWLWGSAWGIADNKVVLSTDGSKTMEAFPNVNVYADGDAYWTDGLGDGNKWMEANTYVEYNPNADPATPYPGGLLTFSVNVTANDLDPRYTLTLFIKSLDPTSFATTFLDTADVTGTGTYTVQATPDASQIIQYGFVMNGLNANPATDWGSVLMTEQTQSNNLNPIEGLSVYPNPVVDRINISAGSSIDQVRIFDLVGRMVKQATPSSNDFSIDVADLNKGVYMVQLKAGNKETTLKIVK